MEEFYQHLADRGKGEGLDRPVRYGVWVLVEPFSKVERFCPSLVNIDSEGMQSENSRLVDLFEREAFESRAMTRAVEVIEGLWVGNDTDVPGGADDGAGASVQFDLCVKASECSDMPLTVTLANAYRSLATLDRVRQQNAENNTAWGLTPATQALRNLLSPGVNGGLSTPPTPTESQQISTSPDETRLYAQQHAAQHHYVSVECAGSCRTITGQMRNLATMTDKVVELVNFLRKLVEGKDKTGTKRKVLIHCQDGYTESSILVLSYIMSALGVSLPEAYLYLQLDAKRSFFLYPTDRPLLHRIEARLAQERRDRALKTARAGDANNQATPSPPSPTSRWKPWGFMRSSPAEDKVRERERERQERTTRNVETARRLLIDEGRGGSHAAQEARIWFEDKRFDGFPSRILPYLYLGNLEHAGNAAMLKSLGISHVVSVGESLLDVPPEHDPLHGYVGPNTLGAAARAGEIHVLDLPDIRDDGNDPLRPLIARACEWMEQAYAAGGSVLVHCRVGVSRSASIVVSTNHPPY
jgi:dual specificity MAP kinase phosphatase